MMRIKQARLVRLSNTTRRVGNARSRRIAADKTVLVATGKTGLERRSFPARCLNYERWASKNASVRSHASVAASSSYRGVVSLWNPWLTPS